ncbi:MAG: hypothetical protein ACKOAF_05405 [Actinomycetes bacterium]
MTTNHTVISAPMSYSGSLARTKNWLWNNKPAAIKYGIGLWAIPLIIIMWWALICIWYISFGIFLIPYRLIRRGGRKRKREERMHAELLQAMNNHQKQG